MSPGRRGLWQAPCHLPEGVLVPSHLSGVRGSRGQASWLALQRPGHVGEDRGPLKPGQQGQGPDGACTTRLEPLLPDSQRTEDRRGRGPDAGCEPWSHCSAERLLSPPRAPAPGDGSVGLGTGGGAEVSPAREERSGPLGCSGRSGACTGGRVRGNGAVLSGDGKGCVQRGTCHPSRSESPRVGQEPCGGRAPKHRGPPCGQAALPGENDRALAWTRPAPAPDP